MKKQWIAAIIASGCLCMTSVWAMPAAKIEAKNPAPIVVAQKEKINLNQADSKALVHIVKGIGVKRAQAIVKYRAEHGAFATVDDVAKVPGIGVKFVKKNHKALNARLRVQ